MHINARAWDALFNRVKDERFVPPPTRPCDICGEPVGIRGKYLHRKCLYAERGALLNGILNPEEIRKIA